MKTILILAVWVAVTVSAVAAPVPMAQAQAEKVVNAIWVAEGGSKTKHPFGILSVKVSSVEEARRVCLNTVKNNFIRWQNAGSKGEYLVFLANRYAPANVANDPTGLNSNWLKNVRANIAKQEAAAK